jgi:hypothetical protein
LQHRLVQCLTEAWSPPLIHQAKETTMPNDSGTRINEDTMNKDYDLVSVLYHALQAAETCSQYQQDAQAEGATEVADFMREVQEQNTRIAQQAKALLLKQQQI